VATLFATCARGLESLLASEIRPLGTLDVRPARAGVSFTGDLAAAYGVCLWSRTASRVLLSLGQQDASDADALYESIRSMPWEDHVSPDGTLAVDFASDADPHFRNSMFGAQRVKDGVVDRLRDRFGRRPSVDPVSPDVRINVRVRSKRATVSIDLSGDALHRRGYRESGVQGAAPLKESLAAAMLLFADWPRIAAEGGTLVDPMCGSGTLLIEGAWIAGDVAPGLLRSRWGFDGWLGHDASAWGDLLAEADGRAETGLAVLPPIAGGDADPDAVGLAIANVARAGLRGKVSVDVAPLASSVPPAGSTDGLIVANPPYGERLGSADEVRELYAGLGSRIRAAFPGWSYAVLSSEAAHATALGMLPEQTHELYNGAIPVRLDVGRSPGGAFPDVTGGSTAFANRLRKDLKHLGKWAKREVVTCWRVYDADLPDYAVAVDLYDCEDGVRRAVVSEYEAPREIDEVKAGVRLAQAVSAAPEVLGCSPDEVRVKVRRRQKGDAQYERLSAGGRFHEVREGPARLLVNLDDYLDVGLFLDHRLTRGMVAETARGGSMLNLFCYTAAATVQAALAGAATSESVDLSNTYLEWARRNFDLNGIDASAHRLVHADVQRYLHDAKERGAAFDVVFLDPPSFSTSKAMEGTLDVQRDHVQLIAAAADVLADGGTLVFSTNLRSFRFGEAGITALGLSVEDVTAATIPPDFERNRRIHRAFFVRRVES
jgi:23S rRNA (guanine2445-N2)-methyltransferase / 23S rRNA (guanine2069-N7)-methyltransferase